MADLPLAHAQFPGVTLSAGPSATRFSLRSRSTDSLPALLSSASFAGGHALGLGPDEWLLILPEGAAPPMLEGRHALTDISHRNLALIIHGPQAMALVQCGCALDLSLAAFPVGKVTRTLYEGVEIILWRTGPTTFHIEAWRSFMGHLHAALRLAAGDLQAG